MEWKTIVLKVDMTTPIPPEKLQAYLDSIAENDRLAADCLENSKRHKHPDFIEEWEEIELRMETPSAIL